MNIRTAISLATQSLKKSASPVLDAEVLLSFVLKKPKEFLYGHPDFKLSEIQDSKFRILIRKRANHWPVAYLTGHKEFFGLDLLVTKDVLVPRPETELLVELALERLKIRDLRFKNIVEVGTGSGNIIISLVIQSEARNLRFFATDTSAKALAIARRNARRNGVASKIKFLRGNLLKPSTIRPAHGGEQSRTTSSGNKSFYSLSKRKRVEGLLIVANLPYLTEKQYRANPDLKHEPKRALVGGKDGMKYFREIFEQLHTFLPSPGVGRPARLNGRSGGVAACLPARQGGRERSQSPFDSAQGQNGITILIEHDPGQKGKLKKLISQHFPQAEVKFHKDLAGRFRVCSFEI